MGKCHSKEKRKRHHAREDLISQLPDSLITHILSYLPTKQAIRTSVLSTRWEPLWLSIPGLDLNSRDFPNYHAFVSFMDKLLDFSEEEKSCLHKVKLSIQRYELSATCYTRWIHFARRWIDFFTTRRLQHLDVECLVGMYPHFEGVLSCLYACQTLVYLRLHGIWLGSFFDSYVSLPCLKTMRLEKNEYMNDACLKWLISSCPVLEDLSIVSKAGDNVKNLRVHSQSLISLDVEFYVKDRTNLSSFYRGKVFINAPRLKYLNIKDELSTRKIVSNLDSLVKVSFDGYFDIECHRDGAGLPKNQMARDFFSSISKVQKMIFIDKTMMFMQFYLEVEPLPQFCNLSCLEAEFCSTTVEILPRILQSCQNLKSIILDLSRSKMIAPTSIETVPQCLLSSLEFVEIKSRFRRNFVDKEVASYFVENSVVLKKLLVHLSNSKMKKCLIALWDLLALAKPSSICKIVYVVDA